MSFHDEQTNAFFAHQKKSALPDSNQQPKDTNTTTTVFRAANCAKGGFLSLFIV
jgi:hypothetical protein